jgi:putative peptidoglycan lipid II flippase
VSSAVLAASFLLVDQVMAGRFPQGGVAALTYGQKITSALVGVVSGLMGYLIFPELSLYVAKQDWRLFRQRIKIYSWSIFALSGVVTAALCFYSAPIIHLLFERGAFSAEDTVLVSKINIFYLLQLPFYLAAQVAIKSLYSLGKGFYMTYIVIVTLFINIIGNYVFSLYFGLAGISLSTSVVYALSAAVVFLAVKREFKRLPA